MGPKSHNPLQLFAGDQTLTQEPHSQAHQRFNLCQGSTNISALAIYLSAPHHSRGRAHYRFGLFPLELHPVVSRVDALPAALISLQLQLVRITRDARLPRQ
eukprot:4885465-Amphidinium_carterae.2